MKCISTSHYSLSSIHQQREESNQLLPLNRNMNLTGGHDPIGFSVFQQFHAVNEGRIVNVPTHVETLTSVMCAGPTLRCTSTACFTLKTTPLRLISKECSS